jgi:hypothetical protein
MSSLLFNRCGMIPLVVFAALLAGCQGERTVILPPSELNGGACVGMSPQDSQTVVRVVSGVSGEARQPREDLRLRKRMGVLAGSSTCRRSA